MKLVIRYAYKETKNDFRIEKIDVPFKTKNLTLDQADACDTLAYRNCEDDEVVMGWNLED